MVEMGFGGGVGGSDSVSVGDDGRHDALLSTDAPRVKPSDDDDGVNAHDDGWVKGESGGEEKGEDPADDTGESGQFVELSRSAQLCTARGRAMAAAARSAMLNGFASPEGPATG